MTLPHEKIEQFSGPSNRQSFVFFDPLSSPGAHMWTMLRPSPVQAPFFAGFGWSIGRPFSHNSISKEAAFSWTSFFFLACVTTLSARVCDYLFSPHLFSLPYCAG